MNLEEIFQKLTGAQFKIWACAQFRKSEFTAYALVEDAGVSMSAVYKNLLILKNLGLIEEITQDEKHRTYVCTEKLIFTRKEHEFGFNDSVIGNIFNGLEEI